jgi:hypothetical protein
MNYAKKLLKVIPAVRYRGCRIYIGSTSCTWRNKTFQTLDEAKAAIDKGYEVIRRAKA